jgi:rod shape-determining protein MreD
MPLAYFYAFILSVILPILTPHLRILYFAPVLALSIQRKNLTACLGLSIICGLTTDIFASQTRLGIYALNYCLTTWCLYQQKNLLFEENFFTISLRTFLFSLISRIIHIGLLYLLGQGLWPSIEWMIEDILLAPLQDSIYAGVAFVLPTLFLPKKRIRARPSTFSFNH